MRTRTTEMTRRRFVGAIGAIGVGGVGIGVHQSRRSGNLFSSGRSDEGKADVPASDTEHESHEDDDVLDWEDMDRQHEAGVLSFPAETECIGNQSLKYTMDGDVKVFEITCEKGEWEVEPQDHADWPQFDHEYTILLNDGRLGYTINGKGFPATEPLVAKLGERILIRYANAGAMHHPMHLHGLVQQVIAKDGYLLPHPYLCDNVDLAPGLEIVTT